MPANRIRPPNAPIWQRARGYSVIIAEVFPALKRRMGVTSDLLVFLHAYASRHPEADMMSVQVRRRVRGDLASFYSGAHFPYYVFDTYTNSTPRQVVAAE